MLYGCIGEKLGHSFSKEIHNMIGAYAYELQEIPSDALDSFMREKNFKGINVTIPYKERVMAHLYEIDDGAMAIGAVNTIVNRKGRLYGYNTDFFGMKKLLTHANISVAGKKVAILGTGGTSKTARAVAKSLGASEILIVSRRRENGAILYDDLYQKHKDIEIVINTTPVGMFPNADLSPVDLSFFKKLCGVADAVYNPLCTRLIGQAKKLKIPAESGLYMLVAQAVRASEIFMGKKYDDALTESIYKKLLTQKQNIVLIGMPASGKTAVGKRVAEMLGRPFTDTDELIVRERGESISNIFAKYGEKYFRRYESAAIKQASTLVGNVIATGGGAILNSINIKNLMQNGRIFFLDRSLDKLIPTEDRPLGSTKEDIEKRYHERYGIYCASCDCHVDANGDIDAVANTIIEEFLK